MRTSPEIDKLAAALAKAQAKLTNPKRNLTAKVKGRTKAGTPYEYEYKYTSLDSLLDLIRPVFGECELFVVQGVLGDAPPYKLVTRVTHSSGQWCETDVPLTYSGSTDPQELGIAISYSRRYSLGPMVGVASEEDMDGKDQKRDAVKPDPVLDSWKAKLSAAGAISALGEVWKAMPQQYRKVLAEEKDAAKARIQEADRIAAEAQR